MILIGFEEKVANRLKVVRTKKKTRDTKRLRNQSGSWKFFTKEKEDVQFDRQYVNSTKSHQNFIISISFSLSIYEYLERNTQGEAPLVIFFFLRKNAGIFTV